MSGAVLANDAQGPRTTLPQEHDYQVQIRRFLSTLAENDFEHGLALCEKRDAGLGLHYFLRALDVLPPERTDIAEALRFNVAAWGPSEYPCRS